MKHPRRLHSSSARLSLGALVIVVSSALAAAQTRITPPPNKYTPAQDVQLGKEAAAEAEKQLPVMRDDLATSYVEDIGRRLADAVPAELRHSEFHYTFKVVNVKEINAFALPGGPMYINRGMIEAARTEGEVASVMAHELSHVALRHGTAQASKATKYEIGTLAGAVIGAIIGGNVGSIVAQGTQFGLGAAFMRFSREYEKQADIEGAQIMARAGYDPVDMANMFKMIEKQSGGGGPQWLSDHPNPGNRSDYILAEAKHLRVQSVARDTRAFDQVKAHFKNLPPAPTTEQATKGAGRSPSSSPRSQGTLGQVEPPSSRFTAFTEGSLFKLSVPSNWRELANGNTVTFAPEGAYGESVFTHGVELGLSRNETHDLRTSTDELIASLSQSNPRMSRPSAYSRVTIGSRQGLQTTLTNQSDATGRAETIALYTAIMRDGNLFHLIAVSPSDEFRTYQSVFNRVAGTVQFLD